MAERKPAKKSTSGSKKTGSKTTAKKIKQTANSAKKSVSKSKAAKNNSNSRKNTNMILVIIIASIALVMLGFSTFDFFKADIKDGIEVNLYFIDQVKNELVVETRLIENGEKTDVLYRVGQELVNGPKTQKLTKSVPEVVSNLTINLIEENNEIEIHASEEYYDLSISEELFCRSALVYTFTDLGFVDNVRFFVGDEELMDQNNQPIGAMSKDNLILESNFSPAVTDYRTVELFFTNAEGDGLISEERTIIVTPKTPAEKVVLNELIAGPYDANLVATLPSDTKVNDVKSDDTATCFVDLSPDFLSKIQNGSTTERLAIYSIVNSITSSGKFQKVQFLFDGQRVFEMSGGHLDISAPFERNEEIIIQN